MGQLTNLFCRINGNRFVAIFMGLQLLKVTIPSRAHGLVGALFVGPGWK